MSVLGRTKFANSRAKYYWGEDSAKQQREKAQLKRVKMLIMRGERVPI